MGVCSPGLLLQAQALVSAELEDKLAASEKRLEEANAANEVCGRPP